MSAVDEPDKAMYLFSEFLEGDDDEDREAAYVALAVVYLSLSSREDAEEAQDDLLSFGNIYPIHALRHFCEVLCEVEREAGLIPTTTTSGSLNTYAELSQHPVNNVAIKTVVDVLLEGYPDSESWQNANSGYIDVHSERILKDGSAVLFIDDEKLLLDVLQAGGPLGELAWVRLHDIMDDASLLNAVAESLGLLAKTKVEEEWEPRLSHLASVVLRDAYVNLVD